jgi:WD40 repeat protein
LCATRFKKRSNFQLWCRYKYHHLEILHWGAYKDNSTSSYRKCLSLQFNDQYLITGGKDRLIKVWDRNTFQPRQLTGHDAAVTSLQIYGKSIFSASSDAIVRIWNMDTGAFIKSINAHTHGGITSLQLSSDGLTLFTAGSDATIRIFSTHHGSELHCLKGHSDLVRRICLNDSSTSTPIQLVSASYDGTIIIWSQDQDDKWFIKHRLNCSAMKHTSSENTSAQDDRGIKIYGLDIDNRYLVYSGNHGIIMGWDLTPLRV